MTFIAALRCDGLTAPSRTPHLTLHGLKDLLALRGIKVSHNAVWQFLRREGLSFKKNSVCS